MLIAHSMKRVILTLGLGAIFNRSFHHFRNSVNLFEHSDYFGSQNAAYYFLQLILLYTKYAQVIYECVLHVKKSSKALQKFFGYIFQP